MWYSPVQYSHDTTSRTRLASRRPLLLASSRCPSVHVSVYHRAIATPRNPFRAGKVEAKLVSQLSSKFGKAMI